jgi:hypothetical protein
VHKHNKSIAINVHFDWLTASERSDCMEKLVTIHLTGTAYASEDGRYTFDSRAETHGAVETHLESLLAEGWRVQQLQGVGSGTSDFAEGWVVVLLAK